MSAQPSTPRPLIGDYLEEPEPTAALWPDLLHIVFRVDPRAAHPEFLGPSARVAYFVGCFAGEVLNGGLSQFLSNSSGDFVPETLWALEEVRAELSLGLLGQAVSIFPDGIAPRDRRRRCDLLFAFEERSPDFLEALDRVYYRDVDALGAARKEDVDHLLLLYLREHAHEPVTVG